MSLIGKLKHGIAHVAHDIAAPAAAVVQVATAPLVAVVDPKRAVTQARAGVATLGSTITHAGTGLLHAGEHLTQPIIHAAAPIVHKVAPVVRHALHDIGHGASTLGRHTLTAIKHSPPAIELRAGVRLAKWELRTADHGIRALAGKQDPTRRGHPTKVNSKGVHENPKIGIGKQPRYVADSTPLFAHGGPSPADVNQHQIGDCYLDSSLAAIAEYDPEFIRRHIRDNGNGTVTVNIGKKDVTVTRELPVDADGSPISATGRTSTLAGGASGSPVGDASWAAYYEKAYTASTASSYDAINGGWPADALHQVTGHRQKRVSAPPSVAQDLQRSTSAHVPTTASTRADSDPATGTHGNHAYTVTGTSVVNGTTLIHLRNPWGTDDPRPLTEAEFRRDFQNVATEDQNYFIN